MTMNRQRLLLRTRPASFDDRTETAASVEFATYLTPYRLGGADYIFEHAIDDVLLEDAYVAISRHVFLERLQLKAIILRHVPDPDNTEVGEARFWANGSKFGNVDLNLVSRELVGPCFNFGQRGIEAGGCVLVGVTEPGRFRFRHVDIVNVGTTNPYVRLSGGAGAEPSLRSQVCFGCRLRRY